MFPKQSDPTSRPILSHQYHSYKQHQTHEILFKLMIEEKDFFKGISKNSLID